MEPESMYSMLNKKIFSRTFVIPAITLLAFGSASLTLAHHSRSNFDLETTLEFSGVVTEYSWRNPHTFATLAVENESGVTEELLFELNSVSVMTRSGWDRDTIQVGDRVSVTANPDFDPNKNLYYSNAWTLEDGTTMYSSGGGAAGAGGGRQPRTPVDESIVSEDFSGIWQMPINRGGGSAQVSLGGQGAAVGLPLTDLGQAELDAYDVAENPWFSCISKTPPQVLTSVGGHRFTRDEHTLRIRHEINDVDRTIYLSMSEHPTDTQPSHLGHSIGWFEGEMLVVDTTHFAPAKWGNGGGLSSSDQKHLVERFTLTEGGRGLSYEYSMTDPVYLSETVTLSAQFRLDAAYPFQDEYGCDPEASSRHL